MHKRFVWAGALALAVLGGPALAQTTTPTPPTPSTPATPTTPATPSPPAATTPATPGTPAAPTPPAATTPATPNTPAAGQNVMQLKVTLNDPTMCGSQLDPNNPNVATYAYIKIFDNVNYPIAKGDHLVYDVLVPKSSTMAAGAVDFNLDGTPNKGGGNTLRDFPDALDQWGLFAHPASDYDTLSARLIPSVDASGKVVNLPVFQRDVWYHRDIDISKLRVQSDLTTQVSVTQVMLAIDEHDATHENDVCPTDTKNPNVTALFANVNIVNTDATGKIVVKKAIYNGEAKLPNGVAGTDANSDNAGAAGFSNTTGAVAVVPYVPATNPTAGQ